MHDLFITCPGGFEAVLEKELRALGVTNTRAAFCGVFAKNTMENVFLANYMARSATRVLFPLAKFRCRGKDDLYKESKKVNWSSFLHTEKTFAIDANVFHSKLSNSQFAALVVKDAICDFFREKEGKRPSVNVKFPHVQLNLFIQKDTAWIYLDTSGAPLHKRGWRDSQTKASIHESLAAGLLLAAGYRRGEVFCDPFCGSGTFLVEAGLIATNTPPGFWRRKWGFFHLPGFQESKWLAWKGQKDQDRIPLEKGTLLGSDKSRETSDTARAHLRKALLEKYAEVSFDEIAAYSPQKEPSFILTNPPYGKRLELTPELFSELQVFLANKAPKAKAFVLAHDLKDLEGSSLKVETKLSFKNGGLPIKLLSVSHEF